LDFLHIDDKKFTVKHALRSAVNLARKETRTAFTSNMLVPSGDLEQVKTSDTLQCGRQL
jgi:hypothetical protein